MAACQVGATQESFSHRRPWTYRVVSRWWEVRDKGKNYVAGCMGMGNTDRGRGRQF